MTAAVAVGCDQAAKALAARHLQWADPVRWLGGLMRLQYAENEGGLLGIGSSLPPAARDWLFIAFVSVFLALLSLYLLGSRKVGRAEIWGGSLVIGGGLGNLIDRVRLGFVRDFVTLGVGPLRTGVFNLADAAITLGVLLMIGSYSRFRSSRREAPQ